MKKYIKISASVFILIIIVQCSLNIDNCEGQWVQTNYASYGSEYSIQSVAISEKNTFAGFVKKGIYISDDNGNNWTKSFRDIELYSIAISGNYAVAGTYEGIFYSADNGKTWIQSLWKESKLESSAYSFAIKDSIIFAGTSDIIMSTDNGVTWKSPYANKQNAFSDLQTKVVALEIAGSGLLAGTIHHGIFLSLDNGRNWKQTSLDNESVYAIAANEDCILAGTEHGIYRSIDKGKNWSQTSLDEQVGSSLAVSGKYFFAGTVSSGIFISSDNGVTWTQSSLKSKNVNSLKFCKDKIYAGTGDGLFVSTDNGSSWNISSIKIQDAICLTFDGKDLYAGILVTGVVRSSDLGDSWNLIYDNKGIFSLSVISNNILAGIGGYSQEERKLTGSLYLSSNSGNNWFQSELHDKFVYSFAVNGSHVFAGSTDGVFHSTNSGNNWLKTSLSVKNNENNPNCNDVNAIAISGTTLFAGTCQGIYRSIDNGKSWDKTSLKSEVVFSVAVNGNSIYAGVSGSGLYRSTDNGESWKQTSLKDKIVFSIAVSRNSLIAGTETYGIYYSADNGENWIEKNEGFNVIPTVNIVLIADKFVYAATCGEFIWRRPISDFGIDSN